MQACKITITTKENGRESRVVRQGEMELAATSVTLRYREEQAAVMLILQGERAQVYRQGDYTLRLDLERGNYGVGEIGIGGSSGEIQTFAHKIVYSLRENSVMALLQYDLLISGEKQAMSLCLSAQVE